MRTYNFSSNMAPSFIKYLKEVELRGLKVEKAANSLRSFDSYLYLTNYNLQYINREVYIGWSETLATLSAATISQYKYSVIGFCKYLNDIGIASYIPASPKNASHHHTPYIYNHETIETIFNLADSWRDRSYPITSTAFVMPCLLRLLYSTAIRIGEALDIKIKDIDFDRKSIILRQTKNQRMRFIPLNKSITKVLKQYLSYREKIPCANLSDPDSYLFINLRGEKCNHKQINKRFHRIIDQLNLINPINKRSPRLHDFRHTACVHSMEKMAKQGYDLYHILPVLSKFMGHTDILSTEYYLRITKEVFPEIIRLDETIQFDINEIINRSLLEDYE